jgi:hypothetical protein
VRLDEIEQGGLDIEHYDKRFSSSNSDGEKKIE